MERVLKLEYTLIATFMDLVRLKYIEGCTHYALGTRIHGCCGWRAVWVDMDTNGQMDEHMVLAVGEQVCHAILYCINFANILWHLLECLKTKITIILINLKWKPSSLPWSLVPWHLRLLGVRSRMSFTEGTLHESEGSLSPSLVGPYSGYSYFKNEVVIDCRLLVLGSNT